MNNNNDFLSIKKHIKKCNDTLTFLKIGDFIKDNILNKRKLFLYDIKYYKQLTMMLIKSCEKKLVKDVENKINNRFYHNIDKNKLDIEEFYVYKLICYFKIIDRQLKNIK